MPDAIPAMFVHGPNFSTHAPLFHALWAMHRTPRTTHPYLHPRLFVGHTAKFLHHHIRLRYNHETHVNLLTPDSFPLKIRPLHLTWLDQLSYEPKKIMWEKSQPVSSLLSRAFLNFHREKYWTESPLTLWSCNVITSHIFNLRPAVVYAKYT